MMRQSGMSYKSLSFVSFSSSDHIFCRSNAAYGNRQRGFEFQFYGIRCNFQSSLEEIDFGMTGIAVLEENVMAGDVVTRMSGLNQKFQVKCPGRGMNFNFPDNLSAKNLQARLGIKLNSVQNADKEKIKNPAGQFSQEILIVTYAAGLNHIIAGIQFLYHCRHFFRGILQIAIQHGDQIKPCQSKPLPQRLGLAPLPLF